MNGQDLWKGWSLVFTFTGGIGNSNNWENINQDMRLYLSIPTGRTPNSPNVYPQEYSAKVQVSRVAEHQGMFNGKIQSLMCGC